VIRARVVPRDSGPCVIKTVDVSQPELAMPLVRELIEELGDVELFIVSARTGFENAALAWQPERDTIASERSWLRDHGQCRRGALGCTRLGSSRRDLLLGCAERHWRSASVRGFQGVRVGTTSKAYGIA